MRLDCIKTFVVVFLISFLCIVNLNAAIEDENNYKQSLDGYVRYLPSLSEETTSDRIDITESNLEYNYELKLFNQVPLDLGWALQDIAINNATPLDLPAHLVGIGTNIETVLPMFTINNFYVNVGVTPGFYGDSFNFDSSNFKLSNHYVLVYRPNENLTFLGGVAIYYHEETSKFPIVGVNYKPNDKLTFDITTDEQNISYSLNDKVDLFIRGGVSIDEFSIRQNNDEKTVRYVEQRLGGGITLKINKSLNCSISSGEIFNATLKYRDLPGKISLKDGALYTEFSLELKL